MSLVKALTELMERKGYNQSHVARAIGKKPGNYQYIPERYLCR